MRNNQPSSFFKSSSKGISLFVIMIGCFVLAGWATDNAILKSIVPGLASMKSNAALLFVLCGIALWMQNHRPGRPAAQALAVVIALGGIVTLAEYVFDQDLGIDQIIFRDDSPGASYPGRMSPAAALAFFLVGLALIFMDRGSRGWHQEIMVMIVLAISGLALIGYLYGVSSLYKIGEYSSMAVHTALSHLLLSLGILFARPHHNLMQTLMADTAGGHILRMFLPTAILVPILLGWVRLWGQRAGLYDTAFGLALMVISLITTLTIFIWVNAKRITEIDLKRKRINDSLQESDLRFRSTLESMIEGCQIIGFDWRYLYLNDAAVRQSKLSRDEMLGRTMMECYPGIEGTALLNTLQRCMAARTSHHLVNEFIFPDGSRGWFELSVQPAPEGIFVLSSDITRHKQAEQALLEREMKLTILFEILPVGISILDAEGRMSYANTALKRMLNISEEGLRTGVYKNRTYLRADGSLMPAEELASARALKENREIHGVEIGVVREDGSVVWTNVSAVPVDLPDWKLVIVTSDITERKQAEEISRKSDERFSKAFRASPAGLSITRLADGKFIDANESFLKMFEFRREDVIGRTSVELNMLSTEQRAKPVQQLREQGRVVNFELQMHAKSGRPIHVLFSTEQIELDGVACALATMIDITERKQAEENLLSNARRLHLAASAGEVGIWDWDIVNDQLIWDETMYSLYGIEKDDFDGAYHAWSSTLHPADRQFTEDEIQAALRGEREYGPEFRVVRPDGTVRVMKATSQTIRDSNGRPVRMIGTNIDITERKQTEDELLKLNTELEAKVVQRTAELEAANQQLYQLSLFDELAGLYNRRGFLIRASEQLQLARWKKHDLLMFYADLDGLKQINDRLGHAAGDEALQAAANALNESFRTSDINARLGGDEFIVLALKAGGQEAQALMDRLHNCLSVKNLAMSVGVVVVDLEKQESIDAMIDRADQAMYAEKQGRRDRRKS